MYPWNRFRIDNNLNILKFSNGFLPFYTPFTYRSSVELTHIQMNRECNPHLYRVITIYAYRTVFEIVTIDPRSIRDYSTVFNDFFFFLQLETIGFYNFFDFWNIRVLL